MGERNFTREGDIKEGFEEGGGILTCLPRTKSGSEEKLYVDFRDLTAEICVSHIGLPQEMLSTF